MIKDTVYKARTRLYMRQDELARLMNVSTITISRWERGEFEPRPENVQKLKDVCREQGLTKAEIARIFSDKETGDRTMRIHTAKDIELIHIRSVSTIERQELAEGEMIWNSIVILRTGLIVKESCIRSSETADDDEVCETMARSCEAVHAVAEEVMKGFRDFKSVASLPGLPFWKMTIAFADGDEMTYSAPKGCVPEGLSERIRQTLELDQKLFD